MVKINIFLFYFDATIMLFSILSLVLDNGILLHGYDVIVEAFPALKHFKLCFFEKSLGSFLLFPTERREGQ